MNQLTDRQAAVLSYIRRYQSAVGYPPSLREIGDQLGIVSTNGVNDHLLRLERKGYITRRPMASRGITLVPERERITHAALRVNGEVWALPAPARHHVLVHAWCMAHYKNGQVGELGEHESGFVTSAGRYVNRYEARAIVDSNGQSIARDMHLPQLFSEDVW